MNVSKEPTASSLPDGKRLMSIAEATVYLGLGRNSAIKYLEQIGAKRKIGRRILYDKVTIDEHLSSKEGK
jgi:hypothetical protein